MTEAKRDQRERISAVKVASWFVRLDGEVVVFVRGNENLFRVCDGVAFQTREGIYKSESVPPLDYSSL